MNALFTQSAAQNDTCGVVILNPSALLRINSVKDLILQLNHYRKIGVMKQWNVALFYLPRSHLVQ